MVSQSRSSVPSLHVACSSVVSLADQRDRVEASWFPFGHRSVWQVAPDHCGRAKRILVTARGLVTHHLRRTETLIIILKGMRKGGRKLHNMHES